MKRFFSMIAALAILLCCVPVYVLAYVPMQPLGFGTPMPLAPSRSSDSRIASACSGSEFTNNAELLNETFDGDTIGDWWVASFDADTGDFADWWIYSLGAANCHSGSNCAASFSYYDGTVYSPDNWLISPELTIPSEGYYFSCFIAAQDPDYSQEHYSVLVCEASEGYSGTALDPTAWTTEYETTISAGDNSWNQVVVDLSEYAGMTVAVAIRHHDCSDMYFLKMDDAQCGTAGDFVPDTDIALNISSIDLNMAESVQLTASVVPEGATNTRVEFTSSAPDVVAVNENGGILALSEGTATITATSYSGHTADCIVTVTAGDTAFCPELIGYGAYGSAFAWYGFVPTAPSELTIKAAAELDIVSAEYHIGMGLLYAYVNTSVEGVYDFISIDPTSLAVDSISEGLAKAPISMAYDYENGVIYGNFYDENETDGFSLNVCAINLSNGLQTGVAMDVLNMGIMPLDITYFGSGIFVGTDYESNRLVYFSDDGEVRSFSDFDFIEMNGFSLSYADADICFNPADGMLYIAVATGTSYDWLVADPVTGIVVNLGPVGGGSSGIALPVLFALNAPSLVGDVDNDGDVDFADVSILQAMLSGDAAITFCGRINADVSHDGKLTFSDVSLLYGLIIGG